MTARPRFGKGLPDAGSLLIRASRAMTQTEDPAAYLKMLARIIQTRLNVSHVGVLLYHQGHTAYVFHTTSGRQRVPARLVRLDMTHPIVDWFRAQLRPDSEGRLDYLSREYLEHKDRNEKDEEVLKEIRRLNATLCVPCFFRQDLVGLIMVGSKANRKSFTQEEIRLLLILSHYAAMGVRSAELHSTAMTDELTGTYNRRSFVRRLEDELARARGYQHPVSLMMVDIDEFKRFNNKFGHTAGDSVLRQLASVLCQNVRRVDVVCRYGGEEFSVILPEIDLNAAELAAVRLQGAIADEVWAVDRVTVSMGIASNSGTEKKINPLRLIEQADQALYLAKTHGRNRVGLWTQSGPTLP